MAAEVRQSRTGSNRSCTDGSPPPVAAVMIEVRFPSSHSLSVNARGKGKPKGKKGQRDCTRVPPTPEGGKGNKAKGNKIKQGNGMDSKPELSEQDRTRWLHQSTGYLDQTEGH